MAKRSNNEGTIRLRKDGLWEARYTVGRHPGTGKQIQRSIYGKTQKEVRQKLQQVCSDLNNGEYKSPERLTLSEWLDIWLTEYTSNVKPYTLKSYRSKTENNIRPALGAVRLQALNAPMVQKFINSLSRDTEKRAAYAPKTIKCIHGILHKALQQAVKIGYIRYNPADNCTLPRMERKEVKPLEHEEIARFLKAIKGHKFEYLFLVDLFTGLRQSEILGLTWDSIDFETGTITVDKQLQKGIEKGSSYGLISTKNGKARKIVAAQTVVSALRQQQVNQFAARIAAGPLWKPDIQNLVFTNEFGGHLSHCTVWKTFHRLVEDLGIPEKRFHDLRHTYAVSSIQAGDDIKTVQENLGHHAAAFTLDVYGHVTEKMKQDSASRMEQYIKTIAE